MAISRNQQNYIIMSVIYIELNDFNYGEKGLSRKAKELMYQMLEEYEMTSIPPYIEDMVNVTLRDYGEIVSALSPYLKDWKWERIPLLSQAILLMSYTHYYKIDKAPKAVVIDVAINLAKKYVEESQAQFINALLDNALK